MHLQVVMCEFNHFCTCKEKGADTIHLSHISSDNLRVLTDRLHPAEFAIRVHGGY